MKFNDRSHPSIPCETAGPSAPGSAAARLPKRSRAGVQLATLTLLVSLSGCTAIGKLFGSSDGVDYRNAASKTKPLDVPPDLSQLARDSRYQVQGGVVSASGSAAQGSLLAVATPGVAVNAAGNMRIERAGQERWLVVPLPPEQLWPAVRLFWEQKGFTIDTEDAKAGVMETNWNMNRAKLPADAVRNTIGKLLGNLYDTGERDRFRTRLERTASNGTEVYISHRAAVEVFSNAQRDATTWQAGTADPQLEAQFLSQLMAALGDKDEATRRTASASGAASPGAAAAASGTPGAVLVTPTSLSLNDNFDRAWRRVGLALDRGGFTLEDRDRAGGLYYVRYIDPRFAGQDEPGFWSKLFGNKANPQAAVRYRIALKTEGGKTLVSVQTSSGGAEVGENGQRITSLLVDELK